jgi:ribose transport system permease protein
MTETVLRTGAEKRRFTIDMRALSPFIALIVLAIAGALINRRSRPAS